MQRFVPFMKLGHAAQHLDGELRSDIKLTEQANVDKHKAPIAKQRGEPVQGNYNNTKSWIKMSNSTH